MSSLQQRLREGSLNPIARTIQRDSFETYFSAGLDLTEFRDDIDGGEGDHSTTVTSSAAFAQEQVNVSLSRRNREEMEEAKLERRVADVVDASRLKSSTNENDDVSIVVPKALHPNKSDDGRMGVDRNDNFLKFRGASCGVNNNHFLSSLVVSNYKSEVGGGTLAMSNKTRRSLYRNSSQSKTHSKKLGSDPAASSNVGAMRRHQVGKLNSTKSRKIAAVKKSRMSKY